MPPPFSAREKHSKSITITRRRRSYQVRVGRPRPHRQHKLLHVNIREACILEQTFEMRPRTWFLLLQSKGLDEFEIEDSAGMFIFERTVGGFPVQIKVD